MLKEIFLLNSANFDFAKVDLSRDLFFLGDNGSGKTSFIRAIHFLYTADIRNLGIPRDKTSFKDYYFSYDDSYIIYSFETFFILMYRRGNEIIKYFSKQKFDIDRVLNSDRKVCDFKEILSYIKSVATSCKVDGVDEYTSIIYGENRKYIDFKIADIKNRDIFLRLFNSVFNIDKAIIDSKSIKKALLTSLDIDRESAFFEPDEYIYELNQFSSKFSFFRELEKATPLIDKSKSLKSELLDLEHSISKIGEEINYRKEYEKELLHSLKDEIIKIENSRDDISSKVFILDKKMKRFQDEIGSKIGDLRFRVDSIKRLKEGRYSSDNLFKARELILSQGSVSRDFDEKQQEYSRLVSGIESTIKSIDNEIFALKSKIDIDIKQQKQRRLLQQEDELLIKQQSEIYQIDNRYRESIEKIEDKKGEFQRDIESFQFNISRLHQEIEELLEKKSQIQIQEYKEQDEIYQIYSSEKRAIDESKIKLQSLYLEYEMKADALESEYKKDLDDYKIEYNHQESLLEKELIFYQSTLERKEGTFRAFLDDEVDMWQESFYPLMDKSLLYMSIDVLKPKILDNQIINIEIDSSTLEKIPTRDEAKSKIEEIKSKQNSLKFEYKSFLDKREQMYQNAIVENNQNLEEISNKIAYSENRVNQLKDRLIETQKQISKDIRAKNAKIDSKITDIKKDMVGYKDKEIAYRKKIDDINQEIKSVKTIYEQEIRDIKKIISVKKQDIIKELNEWEREEVSKIESSIEKLKESRENISKDERLVALSDELELLKIQIREIDKAQLLLDDYQKEKEELDGYYLFKEELDRYNRFLKKVTNNYNQRRERYKSNLKGIERKIVEIEDKIKSINRALSDIDDIEIYSKNERESQTLLSVLLRLYSEKESSYREKLISLRETLQRLSSIKGLEKRYVVFDISLFENIFFISNLSSILDSIELLYELRYIKLDTLKKAETTKFRNFIQNIYSKKLEIFANTEERFDSLVKRVNRELKSVDFGVINSIKIETSKTTQESISKIFIQLKDKMTDIASMMTQESLFFDRDDSYRHLMELDRLFHSIKKELTSDRITLVDTIDLGLSFRENGKLRENMTQINNESSTGGSMLLKIALAISILKVYLKEKSKVFFLIIDEVSRLHSHNQQKLKEFANSSGFNIIFVTPEPLFANANELHYYRFEKDSMDRFSVIELNRVVDS